MSDTILRTPSINTLVGKIRFGIRSALQAKTSWGRNELLPVIEDAISDALTQTFDEILSIHKEDGK